MTTARQRVLDFIRKYQVASANEISRSLGMTSANVRHHLSILLENGLITPAGEQKCGKPGRPVRLFSLSRVALGDERDEFAAAILDELLGGLSEQDKARRMREVALRLAGKSAQTEIRGILLRLNAMVERLNELNYQARWEAHAAGPRVIFGRCPYFDLVDRRPELCLMDAHLLEAGIRSPVRQTEKLATSPTGHRYCAFLVSK